MHKSLVAIIPFAVVAVFFGYLWWVSGVLPVVEKHPNGEVAKTGYVKRSGTSYQKTGRWETFHPNGTKASAGMYEHDSKVPGTWRYWDESGRELQSESTSRPGD